MPERSRDAGTLRPARRETLAASGLAGEVLVADNGSTDGSQEIARRAGARVVSVPERGYGAALLGGIAAAKGRHVVMGDADDSYDFGEVPAFVARLEEGYNRWARACGAGSSRAPCRRFTAGSGTPSSPFWADFSSASRSRTSTAASAASRREAIDHMASRTTGMEFASEMVVKATLFGLRIGEIPVTLRKDGRSRPPHLRTWRDGWRHLRFLLMYSPRWLYLWPGLFLVLLGTGLLAWLAPGPRHVGAATLDVHAMLGAAVMVLTGVEALTFAVFAKVFAITEGFLPEDPRLARAFRIVTLETGLAASTLLLLAGTGLCASVVSDWADSVFNYLDYSVSMRKMIPGALLLVLGAHGLLASFFLSRP